MLRFFCVLVALGTLAVSRAFPDIVDVTVNGSVSGSGGMDIACGLATPGCEPVRPGLSLLGVSYSFSEPNTNLGAFNASGEADLPPPFSGSVFGFADENTTTTAQALDITLDGGHEVGGIFHSAFAAGEDSISVRFRLTEESVMQLFGFNEGHPAIGELLDSHGNVVLVIPSDVGSTSMVLEPGAYQLDASTGGSTFDCCGHRPENSINFELYLHADFAPVPTPEPRGTILAALLSIVLSRSVVLRLRRVS